MRRMIPRRIIIRYKKKKKTKREKKREKKQTKTWSNCGGFSCACRVTMVWSKSRRGKTLKE
jgi:hypothetical protein